MEYVCIPQQPSHSVLRHLRHVPVLHVADVAEIGAAVAAAGPDARRTQRIRYVLDELVHGECWRGGVPQWGAGGGVGVGVRRASVRVHWRLRDRAQRRAGTRRAVPVQTKRAHRIYGLQRRGSEKASGRARQAVPRRQVSSYEQQLQSFHLSILFGALRARHSRVGKPPRVRQLVRPLPAAVSAQRVVDACGVATVPGGALSLLHAIDASIASRHTAS